MNIDALAASTSAPPFTTLPAPPEQTFVSSQDAINAMIEFAKTNGYGMSLKRSKPDGKDANKTRYYYHCDRHGNYAPKGTIRERVSRSTGCTFQILISKLPDDHWYLKVKNGIHNHGPLVHERPGGGGGGAAAAAARQRKSLTQASAAPPTARKIWKIGMIPGDGVGPEVLEATRLILGKLSAVWNKFEFQFETFPYGLEHYRAHGVYMPNDATDKLKKMDAILVGAIGTPDVPHHVTLWGFRLPIRMELKQWITVRPARVLRGVTPPLRNGLPEYVNWVIIQETSEGEHSGHGGSTHKETPYEIATDVSIYTKAAIERVVRYAFEIAKSRSRRRLTLVSKSNGQKHAMILWEKTFQDIRRDYPTVQTDQLQADAISTKMITEPQHYDVILANNSHGDIIADMAAALSGCTGFSASAHIDPSRMNPGVFEPIHGSCIRDAGKGIANPLGGLWSAAEMIKWLGDERAADFLMNCIETVLQWGVKTRDMNGSNSTAEVVSAIMSEMDRMSQ